jgi:hypothetical protein
MGRFKLHVYIHLTCLALIFFLFVFRNFEWVTKTSKSKKKKKVPEAIPRIGPNDKEVIKVNSYVSNMLAISVGLKLVDAIRRVCMYTKATDQNKCFYAFVRGLFPIHELCGTVTALSLARRDVLGQPMPVWKLLLPSVIFHGMANFRGMKVSEREGMGCRKSYSKFLLRKSSWLANNRCCCLSFLALWGLSANFQVEFRNTLVRTATVAQSWCCQWCHTWPIGGPCLSQGHVAHYSISCVGILYQELLSHQSTRGETDHYICGKACRLFGGARSNGNTEKEQEKQAVANHLEFDLQKWRLDFKRVN